MLTCMWYPPRRVGDTTERTTTHDSTDEGRERERRTRDGREREGGDSTTTNNREKEGQGGRGAQKGGGARWCFEQSEDVALSPTARLITRCDQ